MKCLIILASSLMLSVRAQYPLSLNTVDPSVTNDFDLNRLISQVLSQAAAIQPEFTPLQQVADSPAQQLSGTQNQYGLSNNNQNEPEQYALPVIQNQEQSQNQYGLPSQNSANIDNPAPQRQSQEYAAPARQSQEYGAPSRKSQEYGAPARQSQEYGAPARQSQEYGAPARQSQEYGAPAKQSQEYGAPAKQSQEYGAPARQAQASVRQSQQYSTPARQVQEYGGSNRQSQVRNEYNAASSRQNRVRNEYVTPSRETQAKDEFGFPEQQLIRELTADEFTIPSQKSTSFSGRSQQQQQQQQQRGGYSSSSSSSSSGAIPVRSSSNRYSTPLSNDLNTASSSGYYNSPLLSNHLRFATNSDGGEIKKFVYIHTAPPEPPQPPRARIQRPKVIAPDTHFNIIFIKAPVATPEPPPEIELPAPAEQKTLVYVLLKKPEPAAEVRIPIPPPTAPSKPEVYFIRYSDRKNQQNQGDDQPPIINNYDHDESELSPNILPEPVQFEVDPRNRGYTNIDENNNSNNNNVGAYSEPTRKVASKKSSSKSKSQKSSGGRSNHARSHYVSPGSQPFESQSQDSSFKPISKSNSRNRSSGNQSSEY